MLNTDMTLHLRFMGAFGRITGRQEDVVVVPRGISVRELLDRLASRYGPRFESSVSDASGRFRSGCRLFLDGEEVSQRELDAPVAGENLTLVFLASVAGGIGRMEDPNGKTRHGN